MKYKTTNIMNREILFRGLKADGSNELVYGYYVSDTENILMQHAIYSGRKFIEVIPTTVGQFTGLTDKNGVDIYEGDIVKWLFQSGDFAPSFEESVVKYQEYADGWIGFEVFNKAEVIGNIHQK